MTKRASLRESQMVPVTLDSISAKAALITAATDWLYQRMLPKIAHAVFGEFLKAKRAQGLGATASHKYLATMNMEEVKYVARAGLAKRHAAKAAK